MDLFDSITSILTDRFGNRPLSKLPESVPQFYVDFDARALAGMTDADLWERCLSPVWAHLNGYAAHHRLGISMFQPHWSIELLENGRVIIRVSSEADHFKFAQAMADAA